eukprot:Nitzschia sp. Nitz4//scaffold18_size181773//138347//144070//NITZ4_001935-RA/size181773-snap-gene-0.276-mRNA-1//-1//CDS//3329540071//2657//frame0
MDSTNGSDSNSEPTLSSDSKQSDPSLAVPPKKRGGMFAMTESTVIAYGKMFLYFLLLAITVGSAIAVYVFTRLAQETDLKQNVLSVFILYDFAIEQRQKRVASSAERSNAIVTSLFPQAVAQRLMEDGGNSKSLQKAHHHHLLPIIGDNKMSTSGDNSTTGARPIAELFPSATVMFADIVGFTAWSSEREPSQVFELLEKLYSSFDQIAKRKGVFKVETIGDCYMAAAGLPEERDDHALVMARFARDCLRRMMHVVRKLESSLGPSTGDLTLRIGLHSGPVTAGVLRGDKARFQLFGDTVNTAARMESTGSRSRIQLSAETANFIEAADVSDLWLTRREDEVEAKGKGKMKTFWLGYSSKDAAIQEQQSKEVMSEDGDMDLSDQKLSDKSLGMGLLADDSDQQRRERSLDWTTEVLLSLLKRIVAMRADHVESRHAIDHIQLPSGSLPLDEVVEVINLHRQQRSYLVDPAEVEISKVVVSQLHSYVREIASLYNSNHFHNFEHATHVTMSVMKLLARVTTPAIEESDDADETLHNYTYGITSDPLAQFAVTFAALIHDVDHSGVPNATLVREKTRHACHYNNQSVAEQNSVDIAWELLSLDAYAELRACIYSNEEEFHRFRQLVVNAVMATDIADKELGAARKARWVKAFEGEESNKTIDANRKATIVIEHLIQASDVAHTMQHWHVYTRWNERFFHECYAAYLAGRADKDPSIDWYTSELGFFDFYIIPLAKKLKECQVFGVASDEYLNYAEANRQEWERKGKDLVKGYVSSRRWMAEGRFYMNQYVVVSNRSLCAIACFIHRSWLGLTKDLTNIIERRNETQPSGAMEPPMESTTENSMQMDHSIHSSNSPSTQSGSRPTTDDSVEQVASLKTKLLSRETKAITYGKLFMILLLLAIACGSAVAVFKYTKNEQDDEFQVHFSSFMIVLWNSDNIR